MADLFLQSSDYSRRKPANSQTLVAVPAPAAASTAAPAPSANKAITKRTKRPAVLRSCTPSTLTEEQKLQLAEMFQLASSLGYVCQRLQGLEMNLAEQIYARMTNRQGKAVMQHIIFTMAYPYHATLNFPTSLLEEEGDTRTWRSETLTQAASLLSDLLSNRC